MRIKVITYGCTRNQADSELMKGILISEGHEIVNNNEEATIINTCFVKNETEKKVLKKIREVKNKLVITGCLAQARPQLIEAFPNASILGVHKINRINEAVTKQVIDVSNGMPDFNKKRLLSNKLVSIIPLGSGCLGNCYYCCTKQARGTLKSRSINSIITQARNDINNGAIELWLTSQDNGCYGFDNNTSLPELINELTSIKGEFRIRIGMMNPQHVIKIMKPLMRAMSDDKVYKFLHVPVQSGSDKVLKEMNRGYSISDYKRIINYFKEFNIATDIICGYPTETKKDWEQTIKLIKETKPGVLNISRYGPRPGTRASLLKQLPSREIKERSRELTRLYQQISYESNKQLIGRITKVFITENNKGRDEYYHQVIINAKGITRALITGASTHHLIGKII